jgi:hypothetical protein
MNLLAPMVALAISAFFCMIFGIFLIKITGYDKSGKGH